jgi:hypothetical protein
MGAAVAVSALVLLPALAADTIPLVGSDGGEDRGHCVCRRLDVLALSTSIGVLGVPWNIRVRVGAAEILMQVLGAAIGAGVGQLAGEIAAYLGFSLWPSSASGSSGESLGQDHELSEQATSGSGFGPLQHNEPRPLGVGFSAGVARAARAAIGTVAVTTIVFTFAGLRFGEVSVPTSSTKLEQALASYSSRWQSSSRFSTSRTEPVQPHEAAAAALRPSTARIPRCRPHRRARRLLLTVLAAAGAGRAVA